MNDDANKRLEALEKTIEAEFAKTKKSLILTCVGYGVLLLFVVGYTTIAYNLITKWATPETVSAMAITYAKEQLPQLKSQIQKQTKDNVPLIADRLVVLAHGMVPQLESLARSQIDMAIDNQLAKFKNSYMPELTIELKKTLKEAEKAGAPLINEPNIGKGYAELFVDHLDCEMAKIIDDNAKSKIAWLRDEIATLASKPVSRMTANELAERKVLIYWLFLVNNAEVGQSPFSGALQTVSAFAEHVDMFFIDDADAASSAPGAKTAKIKSAKQKAKPAAAPAAAPAPAGK